MIKNTAILTFLLVFLFTLTSCSKDDADLNQIELGIWISLDKKDTLDITTQTDFFRSNDYMSNDHYDFRFLSKDSIQIGYSGKMFVLVEPTNHKYTMAKNELIIDFTNVKCYGFKDKIITYKKE